VNPSDHSLPKGGERTLLWNEDGSTQDFKRSVVEQLLSETAGPAELCRRYNIASGQLYTWKKQYADGKLDPEPSKEAELEARVRKLGRLLGKVTLEYGFLKKAVRNSLKQAEKKQSPLPKCYKSVACKHRLQRVKLGMSCEKTWRY
jgi:transposase-like protein